MRIAKVASVWRIVPEAAHGGEPQRRGPTHSYTAWHSASARGERIMWSILFMA
jgi:hypothetical protein